MTERSSYRASDDRAPTIRTTLSKLQSLATAGGEVEIHWSLLGYYVINAPGISMGAGTIEKAREYAQRISDKRGWPVVER